MTQPSGSDPFEDEIRRALALEAEEPAPDRLLARVAASRRSAQPRPGWIGRWRTGSAGGPGLPRRSGPSWQTGFGLVALVVVVVAGGVLLRGVVQGPSEGTPPVASGPLASGSPSAATPTAPSASATPGPVSSPAPTATPGPSAGSSTGPVGGPVPSDFQDLSVTFVSADDGWLLGNAWCDGTECATIVRTLDGGATWASIPAPIFSGVPVRPMGGGTFRIRFANTLDGWVSGSWGLGAPNLWATHDGGATWHSVTLPGAGADTPVMALETGAGLVHAAYFPTGGAGGIGIATSPIGSDAWTLSPAWVNLGAGPVPAPQIVLQGSTGWLVEVDRAVIAGAHLVNGAWTSWQPPCLGLAGPGTLAAATTTDLVAACDVGVWSTPTGVHFYSSVDGGASFSEAASKVPVFDIQGVAAPAPSVAVVAGSLSGVGSAIVRSSDGGRTWDPVYTAQGGSFSELGFTTPSQGVVIAALAPRGTQLLMTRDGGRTWTVVLLSG